MWTPINRAGQLPVAGTPEQAWLDFKAQPTTDAHERAKDVAAFANAMGGTLIIGAAEHKGTLARYVPMTADQANQVVRDYHEAVRDRVRPAPIFETHTLDADGGKVVVVNIQPFPGQAVAVELKRPDETKRPDAFQFPVRVGTQTKFITPEQLPMFFDAKVRRMTIALENIARTAPNVEVFFSRMLNRLAMPALATVKSLDVTSNTLELCNIRHSTLPRDAMVTVPLDFVESVCNGTEGRPAQLYISGSVNPATGDEVRFFRTES